MTGRPRPHGRRSLVQHSFQLSGKDLGARVITGATLQFTGVALRIVIVVASMATLARLLSPADFGYVAMATVVTELAGLFSNFGFTNVLIQRRRISRLQLDTVFWACALLGAALTAMVFGLSYASGALFGDETIGPLLRVMSLNFVIGSLGTVPWIVMARLLRFRTEFWLQMITVASRAAAAVVCAWAGLGVWSLVVGACVGTALNAFAGFVFVPYLPRLRMHWAFLAATWRTSGSYFGSGVLYYVHTNLDTLLIGRSLGATALGYYQNARSLTDEIRARLAMPLQHVLFPAFSAIQNDPGRFGDLVRRSGRTLSAIVFPVGFGMSACARELVPVLYGTQWLPMVPVLVMLGISTSLRAATAVSTPLFNACDKVAAAFVYGLVGTALFVVGIAAALPFGMNAVAVVVAVTSLYSLWVFRAALRLIGLGGAAMWEILGPPAVASALMWLTIEALRSWLTLRISGPTALLLCEVAAGAVTYLAVLNFLSRQYRLDLGDFYAHLMRRKDAG